MNYFRFIIHIWFITAITSISQTATAQSKVEVDENAMMVNGKTVATFVDEENGNLLNYTFTDPSGKELIYMKAKSYKVPAGGGTGMTEDKTYLFYELMFFDRKESFEIGQDELGIGINSKKKRTLRFAEFIVEKNLMNEDGSISEESVKKLKELYGHNYTTQREDYKANGYKIIVISE